MSLIIKSSINIILAELNNLNAVCYSIQKIKTIKFILRKAELVMFSLCISTYLSAAFEHYPTNPAAVGSGLLNVNIYANAIGVFSDPVSVTAFKKRNFAISSGKRFGLNLLRHHSTAIAQPIKKGFIAVGASFFGDKLYGETIWCLAMGRKLSDKLNIGMGLMIYDLQIKNYGNASSLGINVGWRMELNESLHWRGIWRNINGPTIGKSKDEIPQVIVSALVYNPIPKTTIAMEWEQDTSYKSRLKFGGEFKLFPWVVIHTGHASSPNQTTAGLEIFYKQLNINYAVSSHSHLDLSHWFGVGLTIH